MIPFRWIGHALDIRVLAQDDAEPLFHASDICNALDIPLEQGEPDWVTELAPVLYPLPAATVDGIQDADGRAAALYTVDQVRELANDRPMVLQHDFLTWLEDILADHLTGESLEQLVDAATPDEPGLSENLHYDVSTAARILSRDPVLSYGQKKLFDAMHEDLGLIERENGIWVPTKDALLAGVLVRRNRYIEAKKTTYPQILITGTGLAHIHARLGGTASIRTDSAPAPALVDL